GDEARTALLVVESLPAGTTLFIGSSPVAQAGEDGRATVRLSPGSHEVTATAPTGATANSLVTVSAEETGTLKRMTIPLAPPSTTDASSVVTRREAGTAGKRIAMIAVIVLLMALVATAYFVLRGPERSEAQVEPASAPASAPAVAQSEPGVTPSAAPDQVAVKQVETQAQANARRVAEERARAEAEKANAEKKLLEKKVAALEQAASTAPAQPAVVPPQPQPQPSPAAQDACVGVMIRGGESNRYKLMLVEQPDSSSAAVFNGQTNARGMWYRCGFTAGHRVRVLAFGMRDGVKGAFRATREVVLTPGRNLIEIQANDQPGAAPASPFVPGRRRPRFQRP
ncbi:MAG TPA: hypothetical protein VJZ26_19645, partial [Blastocatellia bacterium]|nr:hypothetical protein [Blastocatellia bacterium]